MISGFCRKVDENYNLLGYYMVSSGNFLPTFQDNLLVPFSKVKNPKLLTIQHSPPGRVHICHYVPLAASPPLHHIH